MLLVGIFLIIYEHIRKTNENTICLELLTISITNSIIIPTFSRSKMSKYGGILETKLLNKRPDK